MGSINAATELKRQLKVRDDATAVLRALEREFVRTMIAIDAAIASRDVAALEALRRDVGVLRALTAMLNLRLAQGHAEIDETIHAEMLRLLEG